MPLKSNKKGRKTSNGVYVVEPPAGEQHRERTKKDSFSFPLGVQFFEFVQELVHDACMR